MKRHTQQRNRIPQPPTASPALEVRDFEQLSEAPELRVEHKTIPGFLRLVPHKWNIDEITRFGAQVGRVAESMQLAYITAVDNSLGVIRVFPLPLLERVYTVMAPQFGWPAISESNALTDGLRAQRNQLRRHEKVDQHLQEVAEHADDVEVLQSLQKVREFLTADMLRLRGAMATPAATE